MINKCQIFAIVLCLGSLIMFSVGLTEAALRPDEILVVVNTESQDSVSIGELYVKLRKIPITNIARISVPLNDYIARTKYDVFIAAPVKKAIEELQGAGKNIRCIVTTYGVPLKVGMQRPPGFSEEELTKYNKINKRKNEEISEVKEHIKQNKELLKADKQNKKIKDEQSELSRRRKKLKSEIDNIYFKINALTGADSAAAVDSELALLLSSPYPLSGWQPNPQALMNRGKIKGSKQTLMVSRLDAPTPELARGLVRTAIEVEETGLVGKMYLDARGLTGKDAYAKFDKDIRRTAQIMSPGLMPVVLNNERKLFGTGEAPSAALYCGWYSLGHYIDAFEWSKGAVGYHVASIEAGSIHNAESKQWVKNMLERGVIATIGPVSEPYLHAFPSPSLFFPLLMSGRYTLAEVFAMTNPLLSWRMILIGDPLYNPFKNNPAYFLEKPPHVLE